MKLAREFEAILARPPAAADRKFCDETREALVSPPRNIAEGFARYGRREFAHFVNIARGSQQETQTNLLIARDRQYLTAAEFDHLWKLSEDMVAATTGLLKHLRRTGGKK